MERDADATVRALLDAAGIQPPESEILERVRSYPSLRAAADDLYLEEAKDFLPVFLPTVFLPAEAPTDLPAEAPTEPPPERANRADPETS